METVRESRQLKLSYSDSLSLCLWGLPWVLLCSIGVYNLPKYSQIIQCATSTIESPTTFPLICFLLYDMHLSTKHWIWLLLFFYKMSLIPNSRPTCMLGHTRKSEDWKCVYCLYSWHDYNYITKQYLQYRYTVVYIHYKGVAVTISLDIALYSTLLQRVKYLLVYSSYIWTIVGSLRRTC